MTKFQKGLPRVPGAGRKVGTPNKITGEIRDAIQSLVEGKLDQLDGWLDRTAESDPAKALELYLRLTEFCVPKLSRTEHDVGGNVLIKQMLSDISGMTAGLPKDDKYHPKYLSLGYESEGGTPRKPDIDND